MGSEVQLMARTLASWRDGEDTIDTAIIETLHWPIRQMNWETAMAVSTGELWGGAAGKTGMI